MAGIFDEAIFDSAIFDTGEETATGLDALNRRLRRNGGSFSDWRRVKFTRKSTR